MAGPVVERAVPVGQVEVDRPERVVALVLLRGHDPDERRRDRPPHRLARGVLILEPEPVRVSVDLAALGPAGEPAGPERLEQHEPRGQAALVAALRPGQERRVVQQVVVLLALGDRVRVDDELGVLLAVHDRLAGDVAGPVADEELHPLGGQPPQALFLVMIRREEQPARHLRSPGPARQAVWVSESPAAGWFRPRIALRRSFIGITPAGGSTMVSSTSRAPSGPVPGRPGSTRCL